MNLNLVNQKSILTGLLSSKKLNFVLSFAVFALTAAFGLAIPVQAGIGISPASIENRNLKPGSTLRQEITISQSEAEAELQVNMEIDSQDIASWVRFEPDSRFIIPQGQQKFTTTLVIDIPAGADIRVFKGIVRMKATPTGESAAGGVSVVKGARMDIELNVTNDDYTELLVRGLSIPDVLPGEDIEMVMKIENKGNVPTTPTRAVLDILDLNQKPLQTLEDSELDPIQVGQTTETVASFKHDLTEGEYFARAKVYFGETLLREELLALKIATPAEPEPSGPGESVSDNGGIVFDQNILIAILVVFLIVIALADRMLLRMIPRLKQRSLRIMQIVAGLIVVAGVVVLYLIWSTSQTPQQAPQDQGAVQGLFVTIGDEKFLPSTGESSATTSSIAPSTEVLDQAAGNARYAIYDSTEDDATVIYFAVENEKFNVISEQGEWIEVKLITGQTGWLRRSDVKQLETSNDN